VVDFHSLKVTPDGKGVADVTAENQRSVPPGSSLGGTRRPSISAVMSSPHQHIPSHAAAVRPVRPEPSWGRVLLTTVQLWVSRRLRYAGFRRREMPGPRNASHMRPRLGHHPTFRRWRPSVAKLVVLMAAAASAVALTALQFAGAFASTTPQAARPSVSRHTATPDSSARAVTAAQSEAVAWITGQVSSAAIIGCSPPMCAALQAQGVSASRLVALGPTLTGVLRTNVVAALPSADQGLMEQYAPALIASFGSGGSRVEIRAVAQGGAAAYLSAERADLAARKSAGAQLLKNPRIKFSAADAALFRAGDVDSRLLATLAALSTQFTLRVTAFGDSSPGAPLLYRQVTVANDGKGSGTVALAAALAMVNAQEGPYLPAHAAIVRLSSGQAVLLIGFAAPNPLGLLTTVLTADVREGAT
jgi:hypothetical protein